MFRLVYVYLIYIPRISLKIPFLWQSVVVLIAVLLLQNRIQALQISNLKSNVSKQIADFAEVLTLGFFKFLKIYVCRLF